jgi:hypothetical protein
MTAKYTELTPELVKELFDNWVTYGVGIVISPFRTPIRRIDRDDILKGPTINFMIAVYMLGIRDYLRYKTLQAESLEKRSKYRRSERIWARNAMQWIYGSLKPQNGADALMSFDNLSGLIGWHPDDVRRELIEMDVPQAQELLGFLSSTIAC